MAYAGTMAKRGLLREQGSVGTTMVKHLDRVLNLGVILGQAAHEQAVQPLVPFIVHLDVLHVQLLHHIELRPIESLIFGGKTLNYLLRYSAVP